MEDLGYKKAGAIVGGKLIDEYGGGICQASTTIYGAAVRSNMKILSRYNHAWPSTYCPIGQDAAVSYGSLDLRFQNTSEYPIYIVAGMSGTKLTVTFYGYQDPSYDEIRVTSQQTGTIAQPADVYQVDKSLKKDEIVKDRSGRVGKRASAQRVYYKNGHVVKRENLPSSYYRSFLLSIATGQEVPYLVQSLPAHPRAVQHQFPVPLHPIALLQHPAQLHPAARLQRLVCSIQQLNSSIQFGSI